MKRSLWAAMRHYFEEHLPRCRGVRPNTAASYRYALALFARWLKQRLRKRSARQIRIDRITPQYVLDFLDHLEDRRHGRSNCAASRNARLAAVKGLFRAVALWAPDLAPLCERMERIPSKRTRRTDPEFLDLAELEAVYRAIDPTTSEGDRDAALLLFAINTGARASEITDTRISQLVLDGSFKHVRIVGKGGRERVCPLWDDTVAMLKHYIVALRPQPRAEDLDRVFLSRNGRALTRSGLLKLVKKYVARAGSSCASLARKRVRVHSLRHSTAVLLLRSGVDISVIRSWLGHVSLETTAHYARMTALDKREALDRFFSMGKLFVRPDVSTEWNRDPALRDWLASL